MQEESRNASCMLLLLNAATAVVRRKVLGMGRRAYRGRKVGVREESRNAGLTWYTGIYF